MVFSVGAQMGVIKLTMAGTVLRIGGANFLHTNFTIICS